MNVDNVLKSHGILSGSGRKTKPPGSFIGIPSSAYYGDTLNIGWGTSSDSGVTYYLDVQFDGGNWNNIYTGAGTSTSYTIPNIAYSNCRFRITCCKLGSVFSVYVFSGLCSLSQKPIPGSTTLISGTEAEGYYGDLTGLITGDQLYTLSGSYSRQPLTTATNNNPTTGDKTVTGDINFHKFSYHGKWLFIPDKPLSYLVTWNDLNSRNLVVGKNIAIGNYNFKIRLMTGGIITEPYIIDSPNEMDNLLGTLTPEFINNLPHNADITAMVLMQETHLRSTTTYASVRASYSAITSDYFLSLNAYTSGTSVDLRTAYLPVLELI